MRNLSAALLLSFYTLLSAQQDVRYGLTANIHHTRTVGFYENSGGRTAPAAGLYAEIPMVQRYNDTKHIFTALEYSVDGETLQTPEGKLVFNNSYLNAMLLLKQDFAFRYMQERKRFMVMGGLKVSYNVAHRLTGPVSENIAAADRYFNYAGIGVVAAAGYRFGENVELYLRYDNGLSKTYRTLANFTFPYQLSLGLNIILLESSGLKYFRLR